MLFDFTIFAAITIAAYIYDDMKAKRNKEFLDETIMMCVLYCMICFSPFVPDIRARQVIGILCCSFVSIHLALNLGLILFSTVINIKIKARMWYAMLRLKWQRQLNAVKIKNRKHTLKDAVLNLDH